MSVTIKNILFDLGGVLLDLDMEKPVHAFQKLSGIKQFSDPGQFMADTAFIDFETGAISPDKFRQSMRHLLENEDATDSEIDAAWCSVLRQVPRVKVDLLREWAKSHRLFLYSNTNAIHLEHFRRRFFEQHQIPWESLFERTFYSHILNDRKPQLSGYLKVLEQAEILPSETLFVDDLQQNIQSAAQSGMHVVHYIPGEDLQFKITHYIEKFL